MLLETENRGCSTWRRVLRQSLQLAWTCKGPMVRRFSLTKKHTMGRGKCAVSWLGAPSSWAVRGARVSHMMSIRRKSALYSGS